MEKTVVRLADELDSLIAMYVFAREALQIEMTEGMGYKQQGILDSIVKKLKELTTGLNSLVEAKIKWDKAAKQLAATMTPAEEMDAVFKYIVSLDHDAQTNLRHKLDAHGIYKWKS